ncbi:MAG: hypothetical protein QNJ70_11380 [Xenococcaceae cyanobacterium MO_207.B15]|nr:hypothetical protein [Xenococcaceae cyanobacterium MO_207.B15]
MFTKENIKEIEPEKSPPPTLNTTVGFPISDTPTIPVVDEIPSPEDKPLPVQPSATESLSETLPQKQEPVIEKSQSPTPTPINQAPLVELKKVPTPSETGVRKTKPEKEMKRHGKGKGKAKGKNK